MFIFKFYNHGELSGLKPKTKKFRDPVMAARAPQEVPTKGNKCMISIQDIMLGSDKQLIKTKLASLGF